MAENSQLSDETKNNSTDTSSTDVSSAVIGNHENAVVPHKISNHDRLVQTMVMVDGEWINVNDTNDQKNMKEDMHKVNKKVVEAQKGIVEAKNSAESAVKYADSAVSASKVNSDAIVAMNSAVAVAQDGVNSAAAAIQQTRANAASDAANIRSDVAKVESEVASAKSATQDSVNALQSDIDATKKDLADAQSGLLKAQAAVDQNQKLINDSVAKINNDIAQNRKDLATTHDQLTSAQKSIADNRQALESSVADINSRIAQNRKDLAAAQQANADTTKKLDRYTNQAIEQGKTIEELQTDDNSMKLTIADIKGNVSQVQDSVNGLTANLKDANGNLATVKALADSLSATLTDHGKNIASLQATAKELSSTLGDADGRLSKVEQTAKEQSTTIGNLRSEVEWKQVSNSSLDTMKSAGHFWGTGKDFAGKPGNIKDTDQVRVVVDVPSDNSISQVLYANNIVWQRSFDGNMWSDWVRSANQGDVDTLQGNITQVKQTADGLTDTLKDAQGDITKVRATAKGLSEQITNAQGAITDLQKDTTGIKATIADHEKNIHTLQADSKTLKDDMTDAKGNISSLQKTAGSVESSLQDASGRLSKVEQTAQEHTSTLLDIQGNLSQVKQTATGLVTTLKDAQGNIDQLQQTAKGTAEQISSVQGDITSLQKDTTGIKATIADHDKNIHTLQADAKSLTDDMNDAKGNISSLQKTATSLDSEFKDHDGRISKVEQTASTLTNEFSDEQGHLNRVEQTANGTQQTVADQQGQINKIKTDTDGIHETLTGQDSKIASINVTLNGLNTKYEDVSGDLNKLKDSNQWKTVTGTFDANQYTQTARIFYQDTQAKNTPNPGWFYLLVEAPGNDRITQNLIRDNSDDSWSRFYNGEWSTWTKGVTHLDIDSLSNKITTNSTQIDQNKKAIALKADQDTVSNLSGEVSKNTARLTVQAGQISSKVSSDDFKTLDNKVGGAIAQIQKNSTAIDQTNKQVILKADQTEVNDVKNIVSQNGSRLDIMDNEIKSKVTSTDVNNIVNGKGYATTSTVQSLITQEAGTINESITKLSNDTVTHFQSITASLAGLQTNVTNYQNDTTSKYTQLSNLMQSKVGTADFEQLKRSVDMQTLDSADINDMKTNGHYFVHNLANNPIGGWVYVDVTGNGNDRIRQDVYEDIGIKHKYRRWFGDSWTGWEEGATYTEVTQLQDALNLRVQKGELLSQINIEAGSTLIQSNKIYFDADSFVMSPNSKAFIPSAYITEINADKITTGTLDVSKLNVKNFSADNIVGGTLNGVVVKTGVNDRYFQTSKDNIYWVRKGSMSLVGNDTYLNSANGLNIADMNNIQLTTWGGATVNEDGSITNNSGNVGHPKIVVDANGNWDPDDPQGTKWGGGPGDNEIVQWVGDKEYTALARNQGFTVHLNDGNNKSIFAIQKDSKTGFYVGSGDNGNTIDVTTVGEGNHIAFTTANFDIDGEVNVKNNHGINVKNLHVTGWLGVDGSKNSIVKTSQGTVAINAYETAEYYFGDVGEGQTDSNGVAYVGIEKLFNETVNTSIPYQVFITAYGPGNVWVEQREQDRFIVKSSQPNIKFGWEIKAKRKGYEHTRLQNVDNKLNHMEATS